MKIHSIDILERAQALLNANARQKLLELQ